MEGLQKRIIASCLLFAFANSVFYALSYLRHLTFARWVAFGAVFASLYSFVQSSRSGISAERLRIYAKLSAWGFILAGAAYLVFSGWRP